MKGPDCRGAKVKLIYMLRVSAFGGKKILVLLKTLVSGAMREMCFGTDWA